MKRSGIRTRGHDAHTSHEPHERWLISYADLVTLLFTLFVVLYAASDQERAARVSDAMASIVSKKASQPVQASGSGVLPGGPEVTEARAAMEKAFSENEDLRSRARIIDTADGFTVSLAEAGFFAPGEADVKNDARGLIDSMARVLKDSDAKLRVEGHTDSLPIATARYPSNWELSSARASVVLNRFLALGISPSRLALAGYGGEQPVADNSTPEGRALNRRVDLVILNRKK